MPTDLIDAGVTRRLTSSESPAFIALEQSHHAANGPANSSCQTCTLQPSTQAADPILSDVRLPVAAATAAAAGSTSSVADNRPADCLQHEDGLHSSGANANISFDIAAAATPQTEDLPGPSASDFDSDADEAEASPGCL